MKISVFGSLTLGLLMTASLAGAADLMPDFADIPSGWTTDRYDPASFTNVGTYQGRNNVLGIGITSAGNLANRALAFQNSFYNTQGRQHAVTGGVGSFLAADLYIPASWSDAANGSVRTDMWGVMQNAVPVVSAYPIIGFTNYGGSARLRVFDGDVASLWVDLGTAVAYDAWTSFTIAFTGSAFVYGVNGTTVYTDSTISGTTGFQAVIMQAYNFADPAINGAVLTDYTANWSNAAAVPEPGFYGLLTLGLGSLLYFNRRRKVSL